MINDVNKVEIKDDDHLSSEKLNSMGDLYLKKGDRGTAIAYFYRAASKLPFAQKERAIAIYKKILKISPSENRAYEEIVNIFARVGLIGEEIRYLLSLAHLYHEKGEYNKINSIYRRIRQIDPQNIIAEKYFRKGKQFIEEIDISEPGIAKEQGKVESEDIEHLTIPENLEEWAEAVRDEGDVHGEGKEAVSRIEDRADKGLFTVTLEESDHEKKPFYAQEQQIYIPVQRKSYKKVSIYTGISLLLIVGLVAIFIINGKLKYRHEKAPVDNKIEIKTGNYEINVEKISKEMVDESGMPEVINQADILENQFYHVSVKAIQGCLPGDFVLSPNKMIFLIKSEGLLEDIKEIKGLNNLSKTIYRSNVAGCGDFSPVFSRFIISHDKGLKYTGISIKGLERGQPVTVKWK